jgi:internalin A
MPIFPPIPIMEKGEKDIIPYFDSLRRGQKPLNEVKVLLVGDGAAGKTSLVKSLTGKAFNSSEKQTHGIQIQDDLLVIEKEQIKIHYWDFGGQEIMHATHQFFLTKDSVYILVLDGRRDENPEYWLKHIATFGGHAPVLIVLNKAEDNRAYDIVKQDLSYKYPNISGYFKVSCKTKEGIAYFKKILQKELFDLDFRRTPFSIDWETVKDTLRIMEEPHISYSEYYKICERCKVYDKEQQNTLLGYLNSLGIVLHFDELKQYDTQVLNPLWLTQAVYRVINSPRVAENEGQFNENELFDVLNDEFYQNEELEIDENLVQKLLRWFGKIESVKKNSMIKYDKLNTLPFIAKVMQQFELSYNLPNTSTYIIPDLLPIEPSIIINYKDYPLHFATEFYFLPPALLPRFIVQTNFNIAGAIKWRTGVVLNAEGVFNAEAVIRVDKESKTLHIFVKGEQKRELLAYIRSVLHGIYDSYEGLKKEGRITELLFLPDRPDISVSYTEIEGLEEIGEEYYSSGKAKKKYKLTELFGEIENPDYTLSYSKDKPVKIFISYSRKKKKFREALVTKLFPLIGLKDNYLEVWHDEQLEPASGWANDIDEALNSSDIVVCLLSDEYLASYYCMYEFRRAKEKDKKIFPVLVNHCGWKETPFKDIQGYFTALEPIVAAKRPQKWQEVYEKIKFLVDKIKK